jgi:hypothetical protein
MDNPVVDVFIGLALIYLLYSFLAATIKELLATLFSLRAQKLRKAIKKMLTDYSPNSPLGEELFNSFFSHELIKYMQTTRCIYKTPSYISPSNFSKILFDTIKNKSSQEKADDNSSSHNSRITISNEAVWNENLIKQIEHGLNQLSTKTDDDQKKDTKKIFNILFHSLRLTISKDNTDKSDTIKLLKSFLDDANGDLEKFRGAVEQWFNDMMDRTTEWYKRQSQWIVLVIGICIAVGFNVNSIEIVKNLSKDKAAREQLVSLGIAAAKNDTKYNTAEGQSSNTANSQKSIDSTVHFVKTDLAKANSILGLGWDFSSLVEDESVVVHASEFVQQNILKRITEINGKIEAFDKELITKYDKEDLIKKALKDSLDVKKKLKANYVAVANDSLNTKFVSINKIDSIDAKKDLVTVYGKVDAGFFPKGWYVIKQSLPGKTNFWGFLITALMISLGSPFWFDLLSKFVQIRGSGPRIDTTPTPPKKQAASVGGNTNESGQNPAKNPSK